MTFYDGEFKEEIEFQNTFFDQLEVVFYILGEPKDNIDFVGLHKI